MSTKKRYNMEIPSSLFNEVEQVAEEMDTTVIEVLKRFIKLGLTVYDANKKADVEFIIREKEKENSLLIIW